MRIQESVRAGLGPQESAHAGSYVKNDPPNGTDPTGKCESIATCDMERDDRAFLAGKMSAEEHQDRAEARAIGAGIGLAVVATGGAIISWLGGTATASAAAGGAATAGDIVAADIGATALAAAHGAADAAVAGGTVTTSGAAASGIVAADGAVAGGVSSGAGGAITNPVVQALYETVPAHLRNFYTGLCAEGCAMSNLVNAGSKLEGATMTTVRIAGRKVMEACPACRWVAEKAGVNLIP